MWKRRILCALVALGLASILHFSLKAEADTPDDETVPLMCQDVDIALATVEEYGGKLHEELMRYQFDDSQEGRIRRGVLVPLLDNLRYMRSFILRFKSENCATH